MKSQFLHEPADVRFLIRLGLYGLVTGISAFVARIATEMMIRAGVGYEANPFSLLPPFEVSGLVIAATVGLAFSLLFLWGQMQPEYKKWAKVVAIAGMFLAFFDAIWDVLLLLQSFR